MDSIPQQLFLQFFLILLNAFFAMTEIAVISLSPARLRKLAEDGDKTAPRLLKLVEEPAGFLSTIQIGITLAGFLASAFAAENFSDVLVSWLYNDLSFHAIPVDALDTLAVIVITIILSYFTLVLGELTPKRIAMQQPEAWARMALGVMHGISVVFAPMMALLNVTTNGTLHLLGLKTEAEEAAASEEDIRLMVENSGEQGAIAQEEQKWIENVFDFGDRVASDVMTPEPDVSAFSLDEENDVILETIQKTGLSRYPVYEDNINDVRGVLNARDFLLNLQRQNPCPLESLLRPAYFVPENVHADRLFRDMQAQKHHLAIVVDEYGGTAGIVTIEDLLEEIVGNIYDEFDPEEPMPIQQISDGVWRVEGGLRVEELADVLDIDLPEDADYDTVSGMVMSCLPSIPEDGAQFTVETNGLRIRVENVQDRKVDSALVEKLQPEPAAEDERDEGDKAEPSKDRKDKEKKDKKETKQD